jgi:TPR repeat protein
MYARGEGVPHDDLKAYHYFNQLVEAYDEDQPYRGAIGVISNAFVAVGVYSLTGIPNSDLQPDPDRARALFQYAAGTFGDPDAEYNLARMYTDGVGGLARDNMQAARWLSLAADKNHRQAEALLGHLLFMGRGLPRQGGRGLMWLQVAKESAQGPRDDWIRDLYKKDLDLSSEGDRSMAAIYLNERVKRVSDPTLTTRGVSYPPPQSPFRAFTSPPPGDAPWRALAPAQ